VKKLFALILSLGCCFPAFAQKKTARMLSGVNDQTGSTYSFQCSDTSQLVRFNSAVAVTATILVPTTNCIGPGVVFSVVNIGAGTVTISATGVTFNSQPNLQLATGQGADLYNNGASDYGVQSGSGIGGGGGAASALSSITAAAGLNSINNADNAQAWNWALTTAAKTAFKITENSAALNGAGSQFLFQIGTLAGSTAVPLNIFNSLTGSQVLPALSLTPTWNTSGVATGLLFNVTNSGSGAGSKLADFQVGGTSQWKVDKTGQTTQLGALIVPSITLNGSNSLTSVSGNSGKVAQSSGVLVNGNCLKADANGNIVDNGATCGTGVGSTALSALLSAAGANSINNGDNAQTWNWQLTTAAKTAFTFTENVAAINGAGSQFLGKFATLLGSTAVPLTVFNSLNGSQVLPAMSITPTWNTSGVATAFLLNVTNTGSGAASKLADFQLGGTSQWKVDKTGLVTQLGGLVVPSITLNGGNAVTSLSGNSGRVAQSSGALTAAHYAGFDANGNIIDNGTGTGAGVTDPGGNGIMVRTGLNTSVNRTLQPTSGSALTWTNGDGVAGNPTPAIVFPSKVMITGALCNNATAAPAWNLPTSSAPASNCNTGSNVQEGTLDFADSQSAQYGYLLPSDWTGAIDAKVLFFDSSTSGTVIWNIQTSCQSVTGAANDDNAFNAADAFGTITLAAPANAQWVATKTGVNITGCSAGNSIKFKISRGVDSAAGAARLKAVELTIRRTL
jgi:hypothetical protein